MCKILKFYAPSIFLKDLLAFCASAWATIKAPLNFAFALNHSCTWQHKHHHCGPHRHHWHHPPRLSSRPESKWQLGQAAWLKIRPSWYGRIWCSVVWYVAMLWFGTVCFTRKSTAVPSLVQVGPKLDYLLKLSFKAVDMSKTPQTMFWGS